MTPLPSRLRASAQAMRTLDGVSLRPSGLALIDRVQADHIARELEEAAQALEASQWMPIETAPKDGTLFLCWVEARRWSSPDGESSDVYDVSQVDFCSWKNGPPFLPGNGYFDPCCGQIGDFQDVTHWMPLPASPSAQVAQEGDAGVKGDGNGR